jgi:PAS domain S-box-containing protein
MIQKKTVETNGPCPARSRDNAERKRPEEALLAQEATYRQIFNAVNEGILVLDLDSGEIVDANATFCNVFGRTPEEILGLSVGDISSGEAPYIQESALRLIHNAAGGEQQRFEWLAKGRDGRLLWIDVSLKRATIAGQQRVLAIGRDITERKRSEEALRESEAKFRALAETAAASIFIYRGTRPLYINAAMEKLTGYTREEILARELWQFVHPDSQSLVRERSRARQQGEQPSSRYEFKIVTNSGEERWVDFTAGMIEFEGQPAAIGTAYDITERKQAEEALRESEKRYRLLAENVTDVIWTTDMDLNYTYISPSRRLLGHAPGQPVPQRVEEALTPASFEIVMKALAEELATENMDEKDLSRSRTLELENYRSDGSTIWVEDRMTFLRDQDGRPVGILGVTRDITERKQAEEALRDSERRFRTLSDATFEGIAIHHRGMILEANQAFATMFGYELSEVMGMDALDFAAPESRDLLLHNIVSAYQQPFEGTGLRKDGTTFPVEVCGRPIPYLGKMVTVAALRDLTERKRIKEALEKAREELENRVERQMEQGNPYGLTFRELTVLHVVAAGKADKEIAGQLGISPLTTHKHLANILSKMGAASRTEACVRALREGLLD